MRATGSLYFTKARYQFYGVIKVQNKTTITIADTRTNIYLSSVRKVRKNNLKNENKQMKKNKKGDKELCLQFRLKQGKCANILYFNIQKNGKLKSFETTQTV